MALTLRNIGKLGLPNPVFVWAHYQHKSVPKSHHCSIAAPEFRLKCLTTVSKPHNFRVWKISNICHIHSFTHQTPAIKLPHFWHFFWHLCLFFPSCRTLPAHSVVLSVSYYHCSVSWQSNNHSLVMTESCSASYLLFHMNLANIFLI